MKLIKYTIKGNIFWVIFSSILIIFESINFVLNVSSKLLSIILIFLLSIIFLIEGYELCEKLILKVNNK
jgi:hypothetical protein